MLHPSQYEPTDPEKEEEAEQNRPFMRMYGNLMEYGIALFLPDGTANGVGLEALEMLLDHFGRRDSPGRCRYISSLIEDYKRHWPYRQANFDLN